MIDDLSIRTDLRAGDLGRIIELHGKVYDPIGGFGLRFEAFVAQTIAEYVLDNDSRGRVWLVEKNSQLLGCSALALRDQQRGQIRWVLLDPVARGHRLGHKLVQLGLDYARDNHCQSVFLETTDGLPHSQTLYEQLGFRVASNEPVALWDGVRPLIRMELDLAA